MAAEERKTTTNLTAVISSDSCHVTRGTRTRTGATDRRRTPFISSCAAHSPSTSSSAVARLSPIFHGKKEAAAAANSSFWSDPTIQRGDKNRKAEKCQRHRVAATTKSASRGCGEPGPRSELRRNNPAWRPRPALRQGVKYAVCGWKEKLLPSL